LSHPTLSGGNRIPHMKPVFHRIALVVTLLTGLSALADTHYVSVNSTNPVPPYTNWATAANVIQDAVDAATTNDTVLVTNGTYLLSATVEVSDATLVKSVSGPASTIIDGGGGVRCLTLGPTALIVSGFTITNGCAIGGGMAVQCASSLPTVTNCFLLVNDCPQSEGAAEGGTFNNCVFAGNFGSPAAAANATFNSCIITNNTNDRTGGAVQYCTLNDCTIAGNWASHAGGGAAFSTLNDCILSNNVARSGGGADFCTLYRSTLIRNSAGINGGGARASDLYNCLVAHNSAMGKGGGTIGNRQESCTFVGNSAGDDGGGSRSSKLINCTLVGNTATNLGAAFAYSGVRNSIVFGNDYVGVDIEYSCLPRPSSGIGNITNAPLLVDTNGWSNLRLQSNSPCINAGSNLYLWPIRTTNDFDGNPRIVGGTVDMGAYEFQSPQSPISYAYLQQYGLPTDGSVDNEDGDNDKATTWQEWRMWTIPTNGQSVLKMRQVALVTNGAAVSWQSVAGHSYTLEHSWNGPTNFIIRKSGIAGQAGTTTFIDTAARSFDSIIYRVSVAERRRSPLRVPPYGPSIRN